MNTQVNSEAPAGTAEAAPAVQVAVAETAPVALTPVAQAIAPTPAAAPAPVAATPRKSVLDDFLDDDETPVTNETLDSVLDSDDASTGEEEGTLDGLEDEIDPDAEVEGSGDEGGDGEGTLEGLEDGDASADTNADLDALGDLEDVAEEEQAMVVIDVFKQKCTDCTHLVPWGTKTHKRCHFSNGNDLCPAQSIRIRRYIPVDQIVSRFMAAESQGDTDRLLTLYAKLKEKAPDVQEEIHAGLKAAREKKAQRANA